VHFLETLVIHDQGRQEDGPAVELANGTKEWWANGNRHREDGPAAEYADGSKEWYVNGEQLTEAEFNARKVSCPDGETITFRGKKYRLVAE